MKIDLCSVAPVNRMPKVISKKEVQDNGQKVSKDVAVKNDASGANNKV